MTQVPLTSGTCPHKKPAGEARQRLTGRLFYYPEKRGFPEMVWWQWLLVSIVAWLTADALFALLIGFNIKQRKAARTASGTAASGR